VKCDIKETCITVTLYDWWDAYPIKTGKLYTGEKWQEIYPSKLCGGKNTWIIQGMHMYKNALRILFSTEEVTTIQYLSKVTMSSEMQCLFSDVNISPWVPL
jgi:hypothetical protein